MPPSIPNQTSPSHLASVRASGIKKPVETEESTPLSTAVSDSLGNHSTEHNVTGQSPLNASSTGALNPYNSAYGSTSTSPYGGGMGMYGGGGGMGMGMYGAGGGFGGGMGGMMGSPYSYGMPPMMGGPLSGLNQFLFGIQNVLSSLGQAVQIVGMNTQAVQQLLEAATAMFDHAVASWTEMRSIEAAESEFESEEIKKRRRRLRALRWAMVTAITYAGYKVIRWLLSSGRKHRRALQGQPTVAAAGQVAQYDPYASNPYGSSHGVSPYGSSDGSSPYGGYSSYGGGNGGYGY